MYQFSFFFFQNWVFKCGGCVVQPINTDRFKYTAGNLMDLNWFRRLCYNCRLCYIPDHESIQLNSTLCSRKWRKNWILELDGTFRCELGWTRQNDIIQSHLMDHSHGASPVRCSFGLDFWMLSLNPYLQFIIQIYYSYPKTQPNVYSSLSLWRMQVIDHLFPNPWNSLRTFIHQNCCVFPPSFQLKTPKLVRLKLLKGSLVFWSLYILDEWCFNEFYSSQFGLISVLIYTFYASQLLSSHIAGSLAKRNHCQS